MKKKIFIAINLPERIKNKLEKYQEEISSSFNDFCPIKWTRKENLHITLFFIGFVEFDELMDVFNRVEQAVENIDPFNVDLENISYAPKADNPKMVWANGKESSEMIEINDQLEKALDFTTVNKFKPHITLGRIIQWQFKRMELDERPDIFKEFDIFFPVESIEIMESVKGGYITLKSINL